MDFPAESSAPADESSAQRQARLRRERRNAKIQASGSARLDKITSLSGRPAPAIDGEPLKKPTLSQQQRPRIPSFSEDPAEVDISEHFYTPTSRNPNAALQQSLESSGRSTPSQMQNPFAGGFPPVMGMGGMGLPGLDGQSASSEPGADDPMMRIMQQMLGGGGGAPGEAGTGAGGLPPGLAALFGGQQEQTPQSSSAYLWRVVHALFSLSLAIYVALGSTFNGSKLGRAASVEGTDAGIGQRLFWIFATAELLLQSSRYFMEKGQLPSSGILGTVGRLLPEPYAGYVRVVGRYSVIYTTVVADAMVVVFVLGAMAWWRGMSAA
ncbi:hypothetical protein B0A49_05546 [Cryomyces minteri]|uniref:Golgi to ER traffic protein 2 n=1 Tax=Cryomyces minteri TaxID=331657 RepID=A0A4U0X2I6_9PEZI|nr:hypothetical protein B0A49_05546 [Cryomyces minteri]